MKFGVREICNVVLKAKAAQKIGNKVFYKNEPVIYFDSLKTSSLEGAATTVYAQGGRGNARLVAWEGERTVTFTMEDALISPVGFSILSGAGLVDATDNAVIMHTTEQTTVKEATSESVTIKLSETPHIEGTVTTEPTYAKLAENAAFDSEETYYQAKGSNANPNIHNNNAFSVATVTNDTFDSLKSGLYTKTVLEQTIGNPTEDFIYVMVLDENGEVSTEPYIASEVDLTNNIITIYATDENKSDNSTRYNDLTKFIAGAPVLVDYYVKKTSGAYQIDITPDKFGGNFYLEASTLFRGTNGVDMPAEFVIPNCKVQSNFTFTMASSGDPSTFTFTMDAFPDYTRWDKTKKVYAAIQVIDTAETNVELERLGTVHNFTGTNYDATQKDTIEI